MSGEMIERADDGAVRILTIAYRSSHQMGSILIGALLQALRDAVGECKFAVALQSRLRHFRAGADMGRGARHAGPARRQLQAERAAVARLRGRAGAARPVGVVGEHNAEVFADLGYSEAEIADDAARGVLVAHPAG